MELAWAAKQNFWGEKIVMNFGDLFRVLFDLKCVAVLRFDVFSKTCNI